MKMIPFSVLLLALLAVGCAHNPAPVSNAAVPVSETRMQQSADSHNSGAIVPESVSPAPLPVLPPKDNPGRDSSGAAEAGSAVSPGMVDADIAGDYQEADASSKESEPPDKDNSVIGTPEEKSVHLTIADPLEPFNRAMFHFNDKLYFWVFKPVAQGYKWLVHEDVRVVVRNFFSNAAFPIRFANCLLQANIKGAAGETGRFLLNTLVGFGGLFDPASDKEINLASHDDDFGQTLGVYGIGHGFYINWPIFGPSSPRDTIGMAGDGFLSPFSWLSPWYESAGVKAYDKINDTSFRIGDYETLKQAAVDPYVALRDAYVQYRFNKVKRRDTNFLAAPQGGGEEKKPAINR
jgi:phospholipid-binding lipoprotein MlaA